jgi:hypothetical protein
MNNAGIRTRARILDVGGGRGECCLHLVSSHQVVVADTTPELPADSRIEKVPGLFSSDIGEDSFDVVVMNHILEHVFSPTDFLASAPFELYTPLVFKNLGDWRHVSYFSRHTLGRFLQKSGFSIQSLTLEIGAYGARRLPVIRAVARKEQCEFKSIGNRVGQIAPLLADMVSPVVITSILGRTLFPS